MYNSYPTVQSNKNQWKEDPRIRECFNDDETSLGGNILKKIPPGAKAVVKLLWKDLLVYYIIYYIIGFAFYFSHWSPFQKECIQDLTREINRWIPTVQIGLFLGLLVTFTYNRYYQFLGALPETIEVLSTFSSSVESDPRFSEDEAEYHIDYYSRLVKLYWILNFFKENASLRKKYPKGLLSIQECGLMLATERYRLEHEAVGGITYGNVANEWLNQCIKRAFEGNSSAILTNLVQVKTLEKGLFCSVYET